MSTELEELNTVALVGNPNAGKTTIFNELTGQNQKVGNYSGVTVSKKVGTFRTPHGRKMELVDLPGCLSLSSSSEDEKVTANVLLGQGGEAVPDVVVCVVDASALERQLRLVLEVMELGIPTVLALNMVDMAECGGVRLDATLLSEELGIPVVPMQANKGKGVIELKQALRLPMPALSECSWDATEEGRLEKIDSVVHSAARRCDGAYAQTVSDKLDAWFLHPIAGWLSFIVIMLAVFWSIFALSGVPMDMVDGTFGALGDWLNAKLPDGDLKSLLVDGVVAGLGGTVIFLPQIIILFFFIGLMESTGYMSRAAYLMDGVMSKVGLSGRAFLPLLSSHACAIPGIMAARTIPSARERFITVLIAPWMSCSARIPVYTTLILLLIPGVGSLMNALMMLGIYSVGIITAFVAAKLLRKRIPADKEASHFLLELPSYRMPQIGYLVRQILSRAWAFLKRAGTVILGLSILLWALQTYPKPAEGSPAAEDGALALEQSYMGMAGKAIEPVMKPLGYDWRMGTAVIASFAAREVFVSNLMITYSIEDDGDEDVMNESLRDKLAASTWPDGSKIYTPLTILSLLVFFIYALQCLPTTVVVMRELNSRKWAIFQLVGMSGFAYFAAMAVFQIGKLIGFQ